MRTIANPVAPHRLPEFLFLTFILFFSGCGSLHGDRQKEAPAKAHSVTISWTPSTSHVAGYNVYRESPPGGSVTKLNDKPIAVSRYEDTTVTAGKSYAYYVTSVSASGLESGPSNRTVVTVLTP